MSSSTFDPNASETSPFEGERRLFNVVDVKFHINHVKHRADARRLRLSPGDKVIVEGRHGPALAEVTSQLRRQLADAGELLPVLRRAGDSDLARHQSNQDLEENAYRFALKCIAERKMKMKLIRTQVMQDGSRLVFFFSSEGRVDFRGLVRDLASRFRTRIEMYQIGVRDGAQMIGGIGPCGRELCCSSFLEHFEPISIRMAKQQGLTLNPSKISGMCGRLMCCLVYEQKIYRRMKRRLPRADQTVLTSAGEAKIIGVDVINRQVTLSYPDDDQRQTLPIDQVLVDKPGRRRKKRPGKSTDDESIWDDGPPRKLRDHE